MREIKTHRTGNPLNEALRLECDDESGKYHVSVKAHGQWGPKLKLEFQSKDFSEDTGGPSGISDELLLAMVLDRLVSTSQYHNPVDREMDREVCLAHDKIREALYWLSQCKHGQVQIIKKEEGK